MLKPTLVLMCGRMMSFGATFVIPVVLARMFTQDEFGTYKQLFLIYMTLYAITQCGMAESLFYFLPRSPQKGGQYAFNSLIVLLLSAATCSAILIWKSNAVSELLGNSKLEQHILPLGLYLFFMTASAVVEIVMTSQQEFRRAALTYAGSDLLRAILLIFPVLVFRNVRGVMLGAVVFAICRFSFTLLHLSRKYKRMFRPDAGLLRQQLAYALPFQLAIVIEILQANFHQYAVSHSFDAATFAIYSIGCLQIPLVELLAAPAGNVMMVQMSRHIESGRDTEAVEMWRETTRKLCLILFPLFGLMLQSAQDVIVLLFTEKYVDSGPIFMIWSATIVLATVQTDSAMRVYAQTRRLVVLNALRLGALIGLMHAFLSSFGLRGAVLITILSTVLYKALSLARLRRVMNVAIGDLLPWRHFAFVAGASLAALASGAIPYLAAPDLPVPYRLVLVGVMYTAAYIVLLWRFDIITPYERMSLRNSVRELAAKMHRIGKRQKQSKDEEPCVALSEY